MQVDLDTLRGFFRSAPFMADMGVEPTAVEPGRVSTELVIAKRHCQHTGVVHAGVIAALADHTMGAAAQTCAADGHWVLTAEFKTSLLRGASGERLIARASADAVSKTQAVCRCEVFAVKGGAEKLCALAQGTIVRSSGD